MYVLFVCLFVGFCLQASQTSIYLKRGTNHKSEICRKIKDTIDTIRLFVCYLCGSS